MYYPWLSVSQVLASEPEAAALGVSEVARSARGFVRHYQRWKTAARMESAPVPGLNQTWGQRRAGFIARHLPQYEQNPTERRRLALIMWACDPDAL